MGKNKNISSSEELENLFSGYKLDCKEQPKKENFWSSKSDKEVSVSREIPYSWEGFEIFLRSKGIIARLDDYKANKDDRYAEYAYIIHAIGLEIWNDQYNGAVAGVFQHNIIARKLGLIDKTDITTGGDKIQPLKDVTFIQDNE